MDLEKFISDTLLSIKKGISSANKELGGGNPTFLIGVDKCENISFDIAVIVEKGSETKGSGGIKVMSVGVEGDLSKVEAQQYVSRIKFNVHSQGTG